MITNLLICALVGFCSCQISPDVVSVEYSSISRGGYREYVRIDRDSVIVEITKGRGEATSRIMNVIKNNDWERVVSTLQDISVNTLPDLVSPTMKRTFDGAFHSEIKITTTDKSMYSHTFDDYDPHKSLKGLMNQINKLKGRYNSK